LIKPTLSLRLRRRRSSRSRSLMGIYRLLVEVCGGQLQSIVLTGIGRNCQSLSPIHQGFWLYLTVRPPHRVSLVGRNASNCQGKKIITANYINRNGSRHLP
jgi:hypothetical protein